MATKRQKLEFQVGANSRRYKREMGRVKGIAKSTGAQVAASLGVGLSTAAAVAGITMLVNKLDDIGKHAKRIGVSTDFFQKMAYAAERSGTSISSVETAMKKLFMNTRDLSLGLQTAKDTFGDLGVTMEDLKGKTPEQQFLLVLDAVNKVGDESEKRGLALKAFGRAGLELMPMLNDYAALADKLESSGNIINEDEIRSAEELKDAITDLTTAVTAMVTNSGLVTWLTNVAKGIEAISTNAEKIKKMGGVEKQVQDGYKLTPGAGGIMRRVPKYKTVVDFAAPTQEDIGERKKKQNDDEQAAMDAQTAKEIAAADKERENIEKSSIMAKKSLDAVKKNLYMMSAELKLSDEELEKEKIKVEYAEKLLKTKEQIQKQAKKEGLSVSDDDLQKITAVIDAQKQLKLLLVDLEAHKKKSEKAQESKKSLAEEKEKLKMMQARSKMTDKEYAKYKLISEYRRKVKEAKTQEEKDLYRKQGNLELQQLKKAEQSPQLADNTSSSVMTDRLARIGLTLGNGTKALTDRLGTERNSLLKTMTKSLNVIENKNTEWGLA